MSALDAAIWILFGLLLAIAFKVGSDQARIVRRRNARGAAVGGVATSVALVRVWRPKRGFSFERYPRVAAYLVVLIGGEERLVAEYRSFAAARRHGEGVAARLGLPLLDTYNGHRVRLPNELDVPLLARLAGQPPVAAPALPVATRWLVEGSSAGVQTFRGPRVVLHPYYWAIYAAVGLTAGILTAGLGDARHWPGAVSRFMLSYPYLGAWVLLALGVAGLRSRRYVRVELSPQKVRAGRFRLLRRPVWDVVAFDKVEEVILLNDGSDAALGRLVVCADATVIELDSATDGVRLGDLRFLQNSLLSRLSRRANP